MTDGSAAGDKIALVVFNNINQDISKGDTETYSVVATLKKSNDAATYNDGETIVADTDVLAPLDAKWDIEDSNGDAVNPTGSSLGGTLTLSAEGFNVTAKSTSATVSAATTTIDEKGNFVIKFNVMAGDEAVYIAPTAATVGNDVTNATVIANSTNGALFHVMQDGVALTTALIAANVGTPAVLLESTATLTAGEYKVNANQTKEFTLTVTIDPDKDEITTNAYFAIELTHVNYATTAGKAATAADNATYVISTDNSNFQTPSVNITGGPNT